jgi:hypothetical protein
MAYEYEGFFNCSDLGLASALSLEFPIIEIDLRNPKKAIFTFADSSTLQEAVNSYWDNTLKVSPLAYFNSIKNLKTRLYS